MFKNLFDLSVKRTAKQAFGFYLVYMILGGLLCGIFSALIGGILFPNAQTFYEGFRIGLFLGPIFAVLIGGAVAVLMISLKKLWKDYVAIMLFVISLPLLFWGGTLCGMIPVAVITTLGNDMSNEKFCEEV